MNHGDGNDMDGIREKGVRLSVRKEVDVLRRRGKWMDDKVNG